MRSIWVACAIACSVPPEAPVSSPVLRRPAPLEAPEHSPLPEPEAVLDPATMCGRAEACCRAFAAAVPNVVEESACAGPADAAGAGDADGRCERMMAGWRTVLERHPDAEPPPECSPPDE